VSVSSLKLIAGDEAGEERSEASKEKEKDSDRKDGLEGQKRYNSAVHTRMEKVTVQPACMTAGQLRDYQVEGLQWMTSLYNNHLNGILADEMGLGKTIQTIALLAHLMETKGNLGPHIILAPKPVLPNWQKEFAKWLPTQMEVVVYDGKPEERRQIRDDHLVNNNFNVLLTHYDYILKDKAVLGKVAWNYIVVDEGHRLKNDKSRLAETLRSSYTFRHRLILTGTPINNNLQELWALLNFLLPTIFNSADNFDDWFSQPFKGMEVADEEILNEEETQLVIHRLHNVLRPFLLRRKKNDVETDLPEKTEFIVYCELSAWQKLYYQQVRTQTTGWHSIQRTLNHRTAFNPADTQPPDGIQSSGHSTT
jgi:SWI/SNF-related matrix-associated actin-dependent regulator of chromatin subfamily A protein 2/4